VVVIVLGTLFYTIREEILVYKVKMPINADGGVRNTISCFRTERCVTWNFKEKRKD
jgi:hypothetical protein